MAIDRIQRTNDAVRKAIVAMENYLQANDKVPLTFSENL